MVMRYWGASETYPDEFAALVDRSAGGIRTGALKADLTRRGWRAAAISGNGLAIAADLHAGRPVIALIQESPGRYHYVVVIDWRAGTVTLHDPARAPWRRITAARFDAMWKGSSRWMLTLLPPATGIATVAPDPGPAPAAGVPGVDATETPPGADACERLVDAGVAQAELDRSAARAMLTRAAEACPLSGAAWRERAGLDALEADWNAAAADARRAVALSPDDDYAWKILATASYLRHDDLAALDAWNRIGEPKVSLVEVAGLGRMRYDVVADAIDVPLKSVLTSHAVALAERRVRDIPAVAAARVSFHPDEPGRVQIDAAVVERDRAPWGYAAWAGMGFDALTARQVSASFSSLTGGGESAGLTWRWWERRPMIAGFLAAPAPRALGGGVWRLDAVHETQTFGPAAIAETRARVAMTLGPWTTERTRLFGTAAVERWNDRTGDVALGFGIEHWAAGARVRVSATATQAIGRNQFSSAAAEAAVRSKPAFDGFVMTGVAGYRAASAASPFSVWPGADTGQTSDVLLRAHPLLEDGVVTSGAFGRRLAFASAEAQRWTGFARVPVRIAPAAFVDLARATNGMDPGSDLQVDAGAGARVAIPGARGVMRIDVAHGLRDGRTVLSAGWDVRWH